MPAEPYIGALIGALAAVIGYYLVSRAAGKKTVVDAKVNADDLAIRLLEQQQRSIDQLTVQHNNNDKQIHELQDLTILLKAQIAAIVVEKDRLALQVSDLGAQTLSDRARITTLEGENARLTAELATARSELAALKKENEKLLGLLDSMQKQQK